jgi:hypothetical protein
MIAWLGKYATLLKVALIAIAIVAAYSFGYHVRSLSCERDQATATADQATAVIAVQDAHEAQTQTNSAAGAQAGQELHDTQAETKDNFQIIYRDVVTYVEAKPAPAVCDLDARGLQLWNAANAGMAPAASQPDASH